MKHLILLLFVLVFGLAPIRDSWGIERQDKNTPVCWEYGEYTLCIGDPVTPGVRPPLGE